MTWVGAWVPREVKLNAGAAAAADEDEGEAEDAMDVAGAVRVLHEGDWVALPHACMPPAPAPPQAAAGRSARQQQRRQQEQEQEQQLAQYCLVRLVEPAVELDSGMAVADVVFPAGSTALRGHAVLVTATHAEQAEPDLDVLIPASSQPCWFNAESVLMAGVQLQEVKRRGRPSKDARSTSFKMGMDVHDSILDVIDAVSAGNDAAAGASSDSEGSSCSSDSEGSE